MTTFDEIAERDRTIAAQAEKIERLEAIVGDAIEMFARMEQAGLEPDPDDDCNNEIERLGEVYGFGCIMEIASYVWRKQLKPEGIAGGEFVPGPCRATVSHFLKRARAALSEGAV